MIVKEEDKRAIEIWKKQYPDQHFLNISRRTAIEVGEIGTVNIGNKIVVFRGIYKAMQEGRKYNDYNNFSPEEITYLNSQGMIWDYETWKEEVYRKAVEIWKQDHQDQQFLNIPRNTIIEVEGVGNVVIGKKIHTLRCIYQAMRKGGHYGQNKDLTNVEIDYWDSQGMIWDYDKWKEEVYRKAVEIWKKDHLDQQFLNMSKRTIIEVPGVGPVAIGNHVMNIRNIYKVMQEGGTYHKFHNLTLEQIDYWNSQGMIWDYQEYKNSQKKDLETKQSTLEKYTKLFHNDSEKAACVVSCLKVLREKRSSRQKEDYHIDNLLVEFDIDLETLQSYLERTRTRDSKEKAEPMKYKEGTLRRFCIDNGYNYDVVRRAIKLHDFCQYDSLEQLINRSLTSYKENGQKEPATWVYEKYGTLIKHVLLKLNLDSTSILTNMTKSTISLEEAIRHEIFLKNKENRYNDWLEQPYNYLIEQLDANKKEPDLIEDIVTAYQSLLKEYHITIEESAILLNSFMQYIETIKGYHKIDVGLETDMTKKLEKIKMYNLEEIDIEDSFFIPLEFEKGVLLGKTSKLYQRRQLLRQYIIDWDLYSLEEKEMIKLHNSFTEEEMKMIEFSRIEINNILEQTKSL